MKSEARLGDSAATMQGTVEVRTDTGRGDRGRGAPPSPTGAGVKTDRRR